MQKTITEVSWIGTVRQEKNEFYITHLFMPKQEAHSINAQLDQKDVGVIVAQLIKNNEGFIKLQMHKHPGQGFSSCFASPKDKKTTEKLNKWIFIGRATEDGACQIDLEIFSPARLSIQKIPVFVEMENSFRIRVSENCPPTLQNDFFISSDCFRNLREHSGQINDYDILTQEDSKYLLEISSPNDNQNIFVRMNKEGNFDLYINIYNFDFYIEDVAIRMKIDISAETQARAEQEIKEKVRIKMPKYLKYNWHFLPLYPTHKYYDDFTEELIVWPAEI